MVDRGDDDAAASPAGDLMRVLFVLSRFPLPAQTGDRLRALHQIEYLAQDHDVHLVCLSDDEPLPADLERLEALVETLQVIPHGRGRIARNLAGVMMGDLPIQTQMFRSQELAAAVKKFVADDSIDVIVSQLARITPNVGTPKVPHVLDFVDALSLGLTRRAKSSRLPSRLVLGLEAKRMAHLEATAGRRADARVVTSLVDADHLEAMKMGSVRVVPVAVSADFFETRSQTQQHDFDILFTGNLGYSANVVACEFLVNEIVPHLEKVQPNVRVALVGARPAKRVQRLASARVHVEGPVVDLKPFFRRSKVALAPMQIGSGIQIKLLEAMAMGVPTVTTTLANTPLGASPKHHLLLGDTAEELAAAAHSILSSPDLGHEMGLAGQAFVAERYTWPRVNADFEAVLASVLG